jgi:hypothetical protein
LLELFQGAKRGGLYSEVMGDAGEGLIDADGKIQERLEELKANREKARKPEVENPELLEKIESLKLARVEVARQLDNATHQGRRAQLTAALAEIDRRIAEITAKAQAIG